MEAMRKFLALILAILSLLMLCACVDDETSESSQDESGEQELAFYETGDGAYAVGIGTATNATSIVIPSVHNGKSVSRIYKEGFKGATRLKSVVIPASVRVIDDMAFSGCTALESVSIIVDDEADRHLTTIGERAFEGCTALKTVGIPSSVTVLGNGAFANCPALSLTEHKNGLYLGNSANPYLILITAKDKSALDFEAHLDTRLVHSQAFKECALKSITLPGGIISFGGGAFEGCKIDTVKYLGNAENWCRATFLSPDANPLNGGASLYFDGALAKSIIVPNNISKINDYAFIGCASINSISLPSDLSEIGKEAFKGCAALESIRLSDGVKVIKSNAFEGCKNIHRVDLLGEIDALFAITLENELSSPFGEGSDLYVGGERVTELIISASQDEIKPFALANCTSIESVTILGGASLTVGAGVFKGCTALTQINCVADEKPSSWHESWLDGCGATVSWGYTVQ